MLPPKQATENVLQKSRPAGRHIGRKCLIIGSNAVGRNTIPKYVLSWKPIFRTRHILYTRVYFKQAPPLSNCSSLSSYCVPTARGVFLFWYCYQYFIPTGCGQCKLETDQLYTLVPLRDTGCSVGTSCRSALSAVRYEGSDKILLRRSLNSSCAGLLVTLR